MLTRDYRYPNGRGVYNKARAKINLTLEVGKAREDGFHQVSMIMQSLRLWDDVELFVGRDTVNTFECNVPFLKMDEKNIAYKAILMMQERFSIQQEGVLARLKFMGSGLRLLKISIKTDEI